MTRHDYPRRGGKIALAAALLACVAAPAANAALAPGHGALRALDRAPDAHARAIDAAAQREVLEFRKLAAERANGVSGTVTLGGTKYTLTGGSFSVGNKITGTFSTTAGKTISLNADYVVWGGLRVTGGTVGIASGPSWTIQPSPVNLDTANRHVTATVKTNDPNSPAVIDVYF